MAYSSDSMIRIETDALQQLCQQFSQVTQKLQSQQSSVRAALSHLNSASGADVRFSLSLKTKSGYSGSGSTVEESLSCCGKALSSCSSESKRIEDAVARCIDRFLETERLLKQLFESANSGTMSAFSGQGAPASLLINGGAAKEGGIDWQLPKLIKDLLSSFGVAGELASMFVDPSLTISSLLKFAVKGHSVSTDWAEILFKHGKLSNFGKDYAFQNSFNQMFGLNKYHRAHNFNLSKATKWTTRTARNMGKAFKAGMTSITSWATELIDSGVENFQEYRNGYKDGGTATAEWLTEATIAVGMTAGAGALVIAAIPSAPVVAVGAIGAGIVWGVDTLWANTIGKGADEDGGNEGLAEYVGEEIVEGGKWLASNAVSFAQSLPGKISEAKQSLESYFTTQKTSALWAF